MGGAICANIHGRGLTYGPFVEDLESLEVVLADGSVVQCDRRTNRELFDIAIHHGGISTLARTCLAGRAAILRYHSVSTQADGTHLCLDPGLAVSPEHFDRQCAYLARHYRVLSLDDLVDHVAAGRPVPSKAVVLTFDDGYLDNYTQAFPILRRHGLNATFYVTTDCIDNRALLWTGLLRFVVFTTRVRRAPWRSSSCSGPLSTTTWKSSSSPRNRPNAAS